VYCTSYHRNNDFLDVSVFLASYLFEFGDAICPMAFINPQLESSYATIKLLPTHDVNDPLDGMVEEKFVEGV
jgi:hypothetical protein